MKKIVFVGQTPPPYGGQAIMIEKIVSGQYDGVQLYHVRMAFSKEMSEVGKINFGKLVHLLNIIGRIYFLRIARNAKILYYPPAGPDKAPVLRDIAILLATRWLFSKTIFHFHAGGVSEIKLRSSILRFLFRLAYYRPDCAILLSELNPPDGRNLRAKREVVIPYGIEDRAGGTRKATVARKIVKVLFVAILKESKGVLVLIEAANKLKKKGLLFEIEIMGKFESAEFEHIVRKRVEEHELQSIIKFLGVLTGSTKFSAYERADIFCFPTFFESETFGVVLLEAMQFSLPIVATTWRGIPSIVQDGVNGFLVDPKDAEALADKLKILIDDPVRRLTMGNEGRAAFAANYLLNGFLNKMGHVFRNI